MVKRFSKLSPSEETSKQIDNENAKKHKKHSKHKKHHKRKRDHLDGDKNGLINEDTRNVKPKMIHSSKDASDHYVMTSKSILGSSSKSTTPNKSTVANKPSVKSSSSSSQQSKLASPMTASGSEILKTPIQVGTSPKTSITSSTSLKKKKKKGKDGDTSSEEERWLDAIESGKLEEVDDELKKIKPKDPNLMTARQRAMFERKTDKDSSPVEQLLALPSGYREKIMTPEMVEKAALKSQKRKQQADEKREKDKKKTMDRLLRKQDSKLGKATGKNKNQKRQVPSIVYRQTVECTTISFPQNVADMVAGDLSIAVNFIQSSKTLPEPPPRKLCQVNGCTIPRRYNCSKTGLSLCSLECYKKNLEIKT